MSCRICGVRVPRCNAFTGLRAVLIVRAGVPHSSSLGFVCVQEEFLLGALMALAISALLAALKAENGQDYVYACFFLISVRLYVATSCTSSLRLDITGAWMGRWLA